MAFDSLIANAGRLTILTALAVEERQEFVHLRRATALTDGNLASHARRLQSGGMIAIEKEFRDGKPVTHFTLTSDGRKALEAHTRRLIAAISHRRLTPPSLPAPAPVRSARPSVPALVVPAEIAMDADEWVD
jgi:DNA-binding MarR family transcriptional regulator